VIIIVSLRTCTGNNQSDCYLAGILAIVTGVHFRLVTLSPLKFALACVTTGGPATQVTWTRDGYGIAGEKMQHVMDYENATYSNEVVISSHRLAGRYSFRTSNAVTRQVSSTINLSGIYSNHTVCHACIHT
jgi:hypothetical protein